MVDEHSRAACGGGGFVTPVRDLFQSRPRFFRDLKSVPIRHMPQDFEPIQEVRIPGRLTDSGNSYAVVPRRLIATAGSRVQAWEDTNDTARSNARQRPGASVLAAEKLIRLFIRSKSLGNHVEL